MTDFLQRMVSQAAGLSSGIKPRLPYQFGWERAPGLRPSRAVDANTHADSSFVQEGAFSIGRRINPTQEISTRAATGAYMHTPESFDDEPAVSGAAEAGTLREGIGTKRVRGRSVPDINETRSLRSPLSVDPVPESQASMRIADARVTAEPRFAESDPMQSRKEIVYRPTAALNDLLPSPGTKPEAAFAVNEEPTADSQIRPSNNRTSERSEPELSRSTVEVLQAMEELIAGSPSPPPVASQRRSRVQRVEPPVEVNIGRVEVTFDSPSQPAPVRPIAPRGFDDYAPLRRYSPHAWNRWRG